MLGFLIVVYINHFCELDQEQPEYGVSKSEYTYDNVNYQLITIRLRSKRDGMRSLTNDDDDDDDVRLLDIDYANKGRINVHIDHFCELEQEKPEDGGSESEYSKDNMNPVLS